MASPASLRHPGRHTSSAAHSSRARAELSTAEEHLRRLDEQTADLAGELHGLIAAAHDATHTHGIGDTS